MYDIKIQQLPNVVQPADQSSHGSMIPLYAALEPKAVLTFEPQQRHAVPTGIALHLPEDIEGSVTPITTSRLTVLNSPGTIDPDFRGEIHVIFANMTDETITLSRGEHIADLRFHRFVQATFLAD